LIRVFSIIPVSLIDCRKCPCTVLFLSGCNMRCVYCQNYPEYLGGNMLNLEGLKDMLKDNWAVEAVKFTGGEPTLQEKGLLRISEFIKRELGLGIAIDTNGTRPRVIEALAKRGLLEAAVDLKAPRDKYPTITSLQAYDDVIKTIKVFKEYNVDYEVRTTVALPIISFDDLRELAEALNKLDAPLWVLQRFRATEHTPRYLHAPSYKELNGYANLLAEEYSLRVKVR